jgi:glycosyltransferase involved in cell wall biosynthesis
MRVLVITESPSIWGAEHTLLHLLNHIPSGIDVEVLIGRDSPLGAQLAAKGIHWVSHDFQLGAPSAAALGRRGLLHDGVRALTGGRRLAKILAEYDRALVFSAWLLPEAMVAGLLSRTPVGLDLHETFSGKLRRRLLALLVRFLGFIISPSRAVLSQNLIRRRAHIIPRPIDTVAAVKNAQTRPADRPKSVGVIGQIAPHKRVLQLVEAVDWQTVGYSLRIVGGEPDVSKRSHYEVEVREALARADNQRLIIVDRTNDVYAELAQCDYVVNCSEHEAFGRTVAEALAVGSVPIVVGWESGPAEIVENFGSGHIVDRIEDIQTVLRSADLDKEAGRLADAQERVLAELEPRAIAARYWAAVVGLARG